jgi:hypothetical protein
MREHLEKTFMGREELMMLFVMIRQNIGFLVHGV